MRDTEEEQQPHLSFSVGDTLGPRAIPLGDTGAVLTQRTLAEQGRAGQACGGLAFRCRHGVPSQGGLAVKC